MLMKQNSELNYRIPTIEELMTDGFEYEIFCDGLFEDSIEDFAGRYTYTVGKDSWRDEEDLIRELEEGKIRTKIK